MTILISIAAKDAALDALVSTMGSAAVLKLWSGTVPASLSATDTGNALITYPLSTSWGIIPATGGIKNLANVPIVGATTGIGGTATYFRVYDSSSAAHMQGTITVGGGGGDLELNSNVISPGQAVSVLAWTLTDGNPS